MKKYVRFIIGSIVIGLVFECIFWTIHYLNKTPNPPLLHPQFIPDLLLAIGFYGSFGLVWSFLLKRFHYSCKEVFVLQGLFGVFLEQKGAVFVQGLATFPIGTLLWLFVFLVYGSLIAIPFQIAKPTVSMNKSSILKRGIIAWVGLCIASFLLFGVWRTILMNVLPEPKFVGDFPLW